MGPPDLFLVVGDELLEVHDEREEHGDGQEHREDEEDTDGESQHHLPHQVNIREAEKKKKKKKKKITLNLHLSQSCSWLKPPNCMIYLRMYYMIVIFKYIGYAHLFLDGLYYFMCGRLIVYF